MQRRTRIIFALLFVFVAIFFAFWYVLNKPHRSVDQEVSIPVTASEIFSAYNTNEATANNLYLDKVIAVSGEINEIRTNQDGNPAILLKSDDPLFGVSCTMKESVNNLKTGVKVTIKGICSGFTSDVVLRDCIIDDHNKND